MNFNKQEQIKIAEAAYWSGRREVM